MIGLGLCIARLIFYDLVKVGTLARAGVFVSVGLTVMLELVAPLLH